MNSEELIIHFYQSGVIKFGCFILKNGQTSPIYINVREVISSPELIRAISNLMWAKINPCQFDLLCGVPYAALPFTTCLSLQHNVPLIIRRKERKTYGTKQQLEGKFEPDQRCLIIEDVATTGSSIIETAQDLKKHNIVVKDVIVLIDREQGSTATLAEHGCVLHAVMTITEIINVLNSSGVASKKDQEVINSLLQKKMYNQKRKSFSERARLCQNSLTKKIFCLMDEKKSNLVLSADLDSGEQLLKLVDKVGPEICILKTHIDIINDFTPDFINELTKLADLHKFLIFEDRKFADIGNTVKAQYQDGIYKIASWANIISAHSISGKHMLKALATVGLKHNNGALLLLQMSSANNLIDQKYTDKTLAMAQEFPEFVIGFIAQQKLTTAHDHWLYMRPGIHLNDISDQLGQEYVTPQEAIIECGCDLIIVGRGITSANDPGLAAQQYREAAWQAYTSTLLSND